MIYGHGDDLYRYGGKIKLNFSSNIYPYADLSALKRHLAGRLDLIGSYPEPRPLGLETAIAERSGVSLENVIVTNGATEAIYLIARLLAEGKGGEQPVNIIPQPTFSEYADACRAAGMVVNTDAQVVNGRKVVWLCNPNNPTGSVIPAADILNMADVAPVDMFIIDQSYEDYAFCPLISDAEAARRRNILLLHSMTKRYCVPGLRLGYAVGNASFISRMKALQPPWCVGALSEEAGLFLTESRPKVVPDIDGYLKEAQRLREALSGINGISVMETSTNFMLCHTDRGTAADLKTFLAERHGMLIRDASNFSTLDAGYFRVAARKVDEDDLLVDAVRMWCENRSHES